MNSLQAKMEEPLLIQTNSRDVRVCYDAYIQFEEFLFQVGSFFPKAFWKKMHCK